MSSWQNTADAPLPRPAAALAESAVFLSKTNIRPVRELALHFLDYRENLIFIGTRGAYRYNFIASLSNAVHRNPENKPIGWEEVV